MVDEILSEDARYDGLADSALFAANKMKPGHMRWISLQIRTIEGEPVSISWHKSPHFHGHRWRARPVFAQRRRRFVQRRLGCLRLGQFATASNSVRSRST